MSNIQPANSSTDDMTSLLGHFGLLSPELRNEIYRLALVQDDPIRVTKVFPPNGKYESKVGNPDPSQPDKVIWRRTKFNGSLLRTCRAINKEATPMFYGQNTWVWPLASDRRHPELEVLSDSTARGEYRSAVETSTHLRNILLGAWGRKEQVVNVLVEMKRRVLQLNSLQKIVVSTGGLLGRYPMYNAETLAKKFTQLLKEIMKQRGLDIDAAIAMIEFCDWKLSMGGGQNRDLPQTSSFRPEAMEDVRELWQTFKWIS